MQTSGGEIKQRKLTITSDRLQKLRKRSDDNASSEAPRNNNDGENKYKRLISTTDRPRLYQARKSSAISKDWTRKMTISNEKFGPRNGQRNSSVAATNKAYIMDLLQDVNSGETGVS